MDNGLAFLKSQVNNAVVQHASFLGALAAHEDQADDPRFSALCSRHLANMREHQRMLEEYQSQLGGEPPIAKTEIGRTLQWCAISLTRRARAITSASSATS